jgi:hypothetical protein
MSDSTNRDVEIFAGVVPFPARKRTACAQAKAYAVLAMADWQLGQEDTAQAMLAKGDSFAPSPLPATNTEDFGESWVAWLFAGISLDEHTALIQTGATIEGNSNQP